MSPPATPLCASKQASKIAQTSKAIATASAAATEATKATAAAHLCRLPAAALQELWRSVNSLNCFTDRQPRLVQQQQQQQSSSSPPAPPACSYAVKAVTLVPCHLFHGQTSKAGAAATATAEATAAAHLHRLPSATL
jgi:hypothetical protein